MGSVIKCNTDGSVQGIPTRGGAGVIFRNKDLAIMGVLAVGLGEVTSFQAECTAIVYAAEKAKDMNRNRIWIEADSQAAVTAFSGNDIPWSLRARWKHATRNLQELKVSHIWREGNFGADSAAKKGSSMPLGTISWGLSRPDFVTNIESPFRTYYRFE
ncbi:hypothetical protein IFM89_017417 [Coptis chinensis]|uniref:RNase H type-1 domain-containing protein n=1 Tax=Coptis chinensis TaxID=261450 RepID=A0A835HMU7_9MAGN|nr:hypothetical protein IFM89_017417 [Coptis chinensis]